MRGPLTGLALGALAACQCDDAASSRAFACGSDDDNWLNDTGAPGGWWVTFSPP